MRIEWLTTIPNPKMVGRQDQGMCGWKLHAIEVTEAGQATAFRHAQALCGLLPRHGWGVDLFIDEPCIRCVKRAMKRGVEVPKDMIQTVERREDFRRRLRAGEFNYPEAR